MNSTTAAWEYTARTIRAHGHQAEAFQACPPRASPLTVARSGCLAPRCGWSRFECVQYRPPHHCPLCSCDTVGFRWVGKGLVWTGTPFPSYPRALVSPSRLSPFTRFECPKGKSTPSHMIQSTRRCRPHPSSANQIGLIFSSQKLVSIMHPSAGPSFAWPSVTN